MGSCKSKKKEEEERKIQTMKQEVEKSKDVKETFDELKHVVADKHSDELDKKDDLKNNGKAGNPPEKKFDNYKRELTDETKIRLENKLFEDITKSKEQNQK